MIKNKTEEFIEKAKKVHGDKYDYSKVEYINSYTKICIICPKHGEFYQKPNNHLNGYGCKLCGQDNRKQKISLTTEEFIEKAKKVHGDKYDYSKVEYINNHTKVVIICPKHGPFYQEPGAHLNGHGCIKCFSDSCVKNFSLTTEKFIEKAKKVHGDKYDYSKVEYINSETKVCIICPEHGPFWQTPHGHLKGNNCPNCNKLSQEEFINRSNKIHHNKYDYSKVEYKNIRTKVCIICPEHGPFWQTPKEHMNGRGCSKCYTGRNSKISQKIEYKLKELNVKYEKEKTFDWLKNDANLYLDFYLPEYNVVIECQGIQHFKPIDFFGGIKKFEKNSERDKLKYKLCKEHGIKIYYFADLFHNYFENVYINCDKLLNDIIM